jgi:hypothetical protein
MSDTQPIEQGPSLQDAVLAMPDSAIDLGSPRDDLGRFAKAEVQEAEAVEVKPDGKPEPELTADEPVEAVEAEAANEPAETVNKDSKDVDLGDYIEIPASQEGEEPRRIKLEEALERYQQFDELQAELENVKSVKLPPVDWDQQAIQHVQTLQKYQDAIAQWQAAIPVQEPSEELLNPNSEYYDPELYYAQMQNARVLQQQHEQANQQRHAALQQQQQRQAELENVQWQRERAKILDFWPELGDQAVAIQAASDLEAGFGISPAVFDSLRNADAFKVIKAALAFYNLERQSKGVAKEVKAKPKLVRSKGTDGRSSQQRAQQSAIKRHMQERSLDSAADALAPFIR